MIGEKGREKRKDKRKKMNNWRGLRVIRREKKKTFSIVSSITVAGEGSDRVIEKRLRKKKKDARLRGAEAASFWRVRVHVWRCTEEKEEREDFPRKKWRLI